MTDAVGNLVIEHLKKIQERLSGIERRLDSIEMRMSAHEDHMRGLFIQVTDSGNRLSSLESDIRAIKRRLDLVEVD